MKTFKLFIAESSLLDKPTGTVASIAAKHSVPQKKIAAALRSGISVEKEHTSHTDVAREIALDHLGEDPDYYEKLRRIEEVALNLISRNGSKSFAHGDSAKHLGKSVPDGYEKLSSADSEHDIHNKAGHYLVVHKLTGKVRAAVHLVHRGPVHSVDYALAHKTNTLPMHKVYAHLIRRHKMVLTTGKSQSAGAQKVWHRLSKEPGVGVHGWLHGKPVNLGDHLSPETDSETHSSKPGEHHWHPKGTTLSKTVRHLKLVAHPA